MPATSRPIAPTLLLFAVGVTAASTGASAQSFDRYGSTGAPAASGPVVYTTPGSRFEPERSAAAATAAASAPAAHAPPTLRRMLSWSGKTDPTPPAPAPVAIAAAPAPPAPDRLMAPANASVAAAPTVETARPALGPPVRPWTQRYAATAPAPSARGAAAPSGGARYYSLHTAYGLKPDAAPVPPQFFGATADMSASETSEPIRRASATTATASTTAAINAARLASEAQ